MNDRNVNQPKRGQRLRYSASLIAQGEKTFYTLTMPTNVLAQCCFVTTRDEDPHHGFQRVLDHKKAVDIARYIDSGEGTIPNSIILSAQPESQLKLIGGGKTIEFSFDPKAFLVIDGQHRVYGFSLSESAIRVPVVIYNNLSRSEEARLFIDVNTKQRQVPNELLLDIKQLAERESEKEGLFRELFDSYSSRQGSALYGLLSSTSRQKKKISRVTFNLAFKPVLPVFSKPNPNHIYTVSNHYLTAFQDGLETSGLQESFVAPTVFRAILDVFPDVARIAAAQYGKEFSRENFSMILEPIFNSLTEAKLTNQGTSVKALADHFRKLMKKDFSI